MGLAEITEDWDHAPSIGRFRTDEAKYLTYWKNGVAPIVDAKQRKAAANHVAYHQDVSDCCRTRIM